MKNDLELKPKEIVQELARYIIGQNEAKKAVAIAIRNRWRRQQVNGDMEEEIYPNNIIMIGPTGVGKTEVARRLSLIMSAPFVKTEATKFTEVGYVGRDVESMVRSLMDVAVKMVQSKKIEEVREKALKLAEEKILDLLIPSTPSMAPSSEVETMAETRSKMRKKLRDGEFEKRRIELDLKKQDKPFIEILGALGPEQLSLGVQDAFSGLIPKSTKKKFVTIAEAREIFVKEESEKLIDRDEVIEESKRITENSGVIFIDEIDKIIGGDSKSGPDVSRQGVQRDLLPLVEGTTVNTKYGPINTDHILFISAGAFTSVSPSELIPELQGRFPIRVEFKDLSREDFRRILVEPDNSLVKQYKALFKAEGFELDFSEEALTLIADYSKRVNEISENIGARRLQTVMNALLEDYLFEMPDLDTKKIFIEEEDVKKELEDIVSDENLSRYIL
ncbi:ATP-dependent protease ATPase subunit HslU [candidate division WOR-3 bacterium]|nr:ATP-dependent protease ATPase subunit HslU [candidate division WOR-3 bacterium]